MTVNYPAGSGVVPLPAPQKTREKKPRRATAPEGNSQWGIGAPPKSSPLRTLSAICRDNGWMTDYIKMPCQCQNWQDKRANCVIWWHDLPPEYHYLCECQVQSMSEEEMRRVAA